MAQLIAYEPWGLAVDPVSGAVFHAVVAGSCWLRMPGRAPQHLMPGDVVLLPTNTPHELVASPDARTDQLARFERDIPRRSDGDMVIQGPGAGTPALRGVRLRPRDSSPADVPTAADPARPGRDARRRRSR